MARERVMADARLRRSMLMTPGNRPDRLRKAATTGADCLVFDLEDSVPPAAKPEARACVAGALLELRSCPSERCVRINALASGFGFDDLASLPLERVDSIMVPKVESAEGLLEVQRVLEALDCDRGRDRPLELVVMLETPRGILQALAIAEASTRTTALFFGSGDYTAATGAAITPTALLYARSVVAAAAGAVRIEAIDAAYFQDVRNAEATREDALLARELGFAGKVVFHPAQVVVANEVFSPTPAELQRAQRIVAGYRAALAKGHGTAVADGVFVAVDLVAPAERLLHRASLLRERDGSARPSSSSASSPDHP
jgi:citrate lyase beta subunit